MVVAVPLFLAACVSVPLEDAEPGQRPADDSDEAGLWQALEREEYRLRASSGAIRDDDLQGYLESVLCRVAPDYCADIRVYVLPSAHFNAAMAPNGMMLIFTGLLVRLEDEAQLAAVMAHEVGHYAKRHSLKQWRSLRSRTGALAATSAIMTAGTRVASTAGAIGTVGDLERMGYARRTLELSLALATLFEHLAYSREQELEADEYGISEAARAGYDAQAS